MAHTHSKIFVGIFVCLHLLNMNQFPKILKKVAQTTLDVFLVFFSATTCIIYIASVLSAMA